MPNESNNSESSGNTTGFSEVDNYIIEVNGTFSISRETANTAQKAKQHVLENVIETDDNRLTASVTSVDGVESELTENFIKKFGDGGPELDGSAGEWITEGSGVLGWVPPDDTTPGGIPLSKFRSTTSVQRGEVKDTTGIEFGKQKHVYRVSANDEEVIKHVDVEYTERIVDFFDMSCDEVMSRSFACDSQPIVLIKPPSPGWIAVATIADIDESNYIWTTISVDGEPTK